MSFPKQSVDPQVLRVLIENSGISYHENSLSWIFTCPRCGKAKKLYISKRYGRFVCWRCKETDNFQGRPEYALAELIGSSVGDICHQLYGNIPFRDDPEFEARIDEFFAVDDEVDDDAFEVIQWPHDFYPIEDGFFSKRGQSYLESRGIPIRIAKEYGLRYSPELRRVFFPIGEDGRLYGYQGRLIVPHEYEDDNGEKQSVPKILSSKGVQRDRLLMFADRLKGSDHAVLCEGPVDAIKAHYCRGNVATMGKEVGQRQIDLLLKSGIKRLYIALDPDANETIERLVSALSGDIEVFEMVPQRLGRPTDLGAMSFDEVYQLFLDARPFETRLFIDLNFG